MWQLEYSQGVKLFFLDNYPYTFDLLVKIEEMKFLPDGIIPAGSRALDEENWYVWSTLEHEIVFRIDGKKLTIRVVKPIDQK